jgi:HK97 gp10 family phage protein
MYESQIPLVVKKIEGNVAKALEKIGIYLDGEIVKNIDRYKAVDTGRLKGSIMHKVEDMAVYNGTNVDYAMYQEFGTGIYAENGQGRQAPWAYQTAEGGWIWTRGSKPRPFLRDAYRNGGARIREIASEEMRLE